MTYEVEQWLYCTNLYGGCHGSDVSVNLRAQADDCTFLSISI